MADITWRDVRADFSGANQAMAGASQSISQAGNIFNRMRELQASEQKAAQDELYRQRALEESVRQFEVTSGLDREKFGVTSELDRERLRLAQQQQKEGIRQFDIEQRDRMLGRQLQLGEGTQEYPETLKRGLGFPTSGVTSSTGSRTTFDLNALTQDVSNRYGINPRVMSNLFNVESGGDPNAVSSAGAQGLGQLMPETARDLGVTDPFNPIQNAEGSAKYLSNMLNRYGNLEDALAAYNWGPGNMDKYIAGGRTGSMPQETKDYITRVTAGISPQEVSTNFSIAREDAVRRQNDRARILGERASLVSPMESTTRTIVIPPPTGTLNSPLLGLSNPSQDRIDAMIARGSTPSSNLIRQAEITQKDINEKELKEEKRLFSNDLVFRSMVDSEGDPEDARARFESNYIATYGEKPATNPLDRAVELAKKDNELKEKVKEGNKAATDKLHKTLATQYEDFISNRVDPDYKYSYENNVTRAAMNNRLFGFDPTKEDAIKGSLIRSVLQNDIGDKTGWIFESRADKFATTAFGISDEATNALQALSTFDPSIQSLEDMTPTMKLMYNSAIDSGLIPKEIQNQLSETTRTVRSEREEDKTRREILESGPQPGVNTQARYRELTKRLDISAEERKENLTGLEAEMSKDIRNRVPQDREARTVELLSKEFRRIANPGGRRHIGEQPLTEIPQEFIPIFTTDTNNRFKIFEDKVNQYYSGNRSKTDSALLALRDLRREINQGS